MLISLCSLILICCQCFVLFELNRKPQGKEALATLSCEPPRAEHDREVETMALGSKTENTAVTNTLRGRKKFTRHSHEKTGNLKVPIKVPF